MPALAQQRPNADIENIGMRDINPGFRPQTPDIATEIAMGRQASGELEQKVKLSTDPVVTEYVNRVGQNIVRNSDVTIPFTIRVIDSDEISIFALPGGFLYVNSGLILAADSEAELAGLMSHGVAHVAARHAAEQQGQASFFNIISMPTMLLGGLPGSIIQQAAAIGLPATFIAFGRNAEEEADFLGLQYAYKAGYDARAIVDFFEKLEARDVQRKKLSGLFATHPPTLDRTTLSREAISAYLPARERSVLTTAEFEGVKGRLTSLQAAK
jgi:predicted Zn-dependent protease